MRIDILGRADRPREKLLERGASTLGDNELLAVLLGTGTRRGSALELANEVLSLTGGLQGLDQTGPAARAKLRGLKQARATRILAALELGRRAASPAKSPRPRFCVPCDAARFLMPRVGTKPLEEFGVLVLDSRNGLRGVEVVSKGSLNGSLVHPREVYREAAIRRAAAIIAFHNHPSGDPTPSREDRELTRRLHRAGEILGIGLLDHVILAAGQYWSFKEHDEI